MEGQVGIPFRCPKCLAKHYFGMLKLRGGRPDPCPNCHTELVRVHAAQTAEASHGENLYTARRKRR